MVIFPPLYLSPSPPLSLTLYFSPSLSLSLPLPHSLAPTSVFLPTHSLSIKFVIKMNETQRAAAVRLSSVNPGGDGSLLVLDLGFGALFDFMGNPSPFQSNNAPSVMFTLQEVPDLTPPILFFATLNYGTGLLTITGGETLDGTTLTPATCVNGSALIILSLNASLGFIPTRLTGTEVASDARSDGMTLLSAFLRRHV